MSHRGDDRLLSDFAGIDGLRVDGIVNNANLTNRKLRGQTNVPITLVASGSDGPDGPLSARSCRFGESVLSDTFLGSPCAQPALVVALSERHTPRAQDVVCGDGVEIEVGQRKRKDEGLRREG